MAPALKAGPGSGASVSGRGWSLIAGLHEWQTLAAFGLLLVLFTLFPLFSDSPFRLRVLTLGFIFGTLALGLSLSLGFTGLLNLSQGTFYGIGAYTAANVMKHYDFPLLAAMLAGGAAAAVAGLGLAVTTYRAKGDYFSLVSLALTIAGFVVMLHWSAVTQRPEGLTGIPLASIFGHQLESNVDLYFAALALLTIGFLLVYLLTHSWAGRAMLAVRYDETAAAMMGVSVGYFKFLSLGMGSFIAGLAGALMAVTLLVVSPDSFQFNPSFNITIMVIAGGLVKLVGIVISAIALTFMTAQFSTLYQYSQMIFGIVLMCAVFAQGGVFRSLAHQVKGARGRLLRRDRSRRAAERARVVGDVHATVLTDRESSSEGGAGVDGSRAADDILVVRDVYAGYDGRDYLRSVNLHVRRGEIVGVLGTNGAGKSTLFRVISGLLTASRGRVLFEGEEMQGLPSHRIVKRGIAQVPQGRYLFGGLSTVGNLRIGAFARDGRADVDGDISKLLARWPVLVPLRERQARLLSGGEQEIVAICRALMSAPKLLLLDEPSMGLSPVALREAFEMLKVLRAERGLSILLVEQNIPAALELVDRVYIMAHGEVIGESEADRITGTEVVEAYFGRTRSIPAS
jgi:ABC-type branched-subunit amino acid transport system ATPase component/ABC-type branched-subunit amino acid transport system permease subunit